MENRHKLVALMLLMLLVSSCAADGGLAGKGKPVDKEATRLVFCESAQKIDIAFQTIAAAAPGVIPGKVMDAEGGFIDTVGFTAGKPDPARTGSACAKVYTGDLDVAINTAIIATVQISKLIQAWQRS